MTTHTERYDRGDWVEHINEMETLGWAVRHIITQVGSLTVVVVYEREGLAPDEAYPQVQFG